MQTLKAIHVFCAYSTGLGFFLRGVFAIVQNPLGQHRLTKTIPHIIDSCLLISGFLMVYSWAIPLTSQAWLMAKTMALFIYIAFGLMMIRWGITVRRRWIGLLGGLLTYSYIVGAAHSKSVLSLLSFYR